ncbi:MAG: hypothetical protein ACTSWP_09170 [Candidatus Freyarchaeota archaeon]|nr:hypothetical protein [Candidatus Freyrarchaeum guaymaensis]
MLKVRDRDAPVTQEGLIFRVYGYDHPPTACVCDVEYAPETIYQSSDPRAVRDGLPIVYYKFYGDEGLRFVMEKYPQYTFFHEPLQRRMVGVREGQLSEVRRPDHRFQLLFSEEPDRMIDATISVVEMVMEVSGLSYGDFGVFGSILHDFYNEYFSDIDLVVYGRRNLLDLIEALKCLYEEGGPLANEFSQPSQHLSKNWRFKNYTLQEYLFYEERKMIYAVYDSPELGRKVKVEFEPVKDWSEIRNEYDPRSRITFKGWTRVEATVAGDEDSYFTPAVYLLEDVETVSGARADDAVRAVTYVEEFRMMAREGDRVLIEGMLEEVQTPKRTFHQITLSYVPGEKYYDQVLKPSTLPPVK